MASQTEIDFVKLFFNGNNTILANWSDEQIGVLIDSGMSGIDCAIFMVDSTLSLYTTKPNIKVGQISLDWNAVINGLDKLKVDLMLRKDQGAGVPGSGGGTRSRRIGGALFTGNQVPRKFDDGALDNPPFEGYKPWVI